MKSIIETIQKRLELIDLEGEQDNLAKSLFDFAEILKKGELYSIVMDGYLLAKHGKYDANFQPCSKENLLSKWNKLLNTK